VASRIGEPGAHRKEGATNTCESEHNAGGGC
jgi:hypothetical protein